MEKKLTAALFYMCTLIADGIEYPDAEWKASQKYGVKSNALRALYDAL